MYDLIQWIIVQKVDPEHVKAEEESVIAQRDTSKAVRVNLTNKIKAVKVARKLEVLQDDVNNLLDCSEFASTTDRDLLFEARANFRPLREEGRDYKAEPGMSELLDELSLKIKQLNDRACKATVERPTTPSSISFPKMEGKTNSYHSQLKLKLPNFNGNPLECRTFWNLFDSLISQEKGVIDEQKACHLTDTMADSKAKEIAKISTRTGG